ncbi:MAG: FAD:protein FMN transferase [Flavobacteriales bacterium]|jgi:thiamine biosynthesis lipoprotein|nr:FAD:protein FMN transferase [Flavobacteriales bacterium]
MKKLLSIVLMVVLFSCEENKIQKFQLSGRAQGTTFGVIYFGGKEEPGLNEDLANLFQEVDQSLSTYLPTSYISRWNRNEVNHGEIDTHFINMFQMSQQVFQESEAYFDPTVEPLSQFYGFEKRGGVSPISLDSARALVGLSKLILKENGFLQKSDSSIQINFNSIAQGYTVDLIKELLMAKGIQNFLIELGGEIYAQGKKPKNMPWKIAIDKAEENRNGEFSNKLDIENTAVATSGNYRKWKLSPDKTEKYVHTINPLTGKSQATDIQSVTILMPSCALADAYATAILAMGLDKSLKLRNSLKQKGYQVYLIE